MEYKNIILLKDTNDVRTDGIILTNEDENVIQNAINIAKQEFYKLEEQGKIPEFINCEFEYITYILQDNYNLKILPSWNSGEVYY